MNITFWKAVKGDGVTIDLNGFEPKYGYELFLKTLCEYLKENLIDWHQGIESGIGHISYKGATLTVFWTDFPLALSFDCRDEEMAVELQAAIERYLKKS